MRKILFRGKRRDNGEWVYGLLKYDSAGNPGCICGWMGDNGGETYQEIEVIPETVGQFIGRKDKNGKEIYDGDILGQDCAMVDDYTGKNSIEVLKLVVRWSNEKLCWTVYSSTAINKGDWNYIPSNCYVIGNIHEQKVTP